MSTNLDLLTLVYGDQHVELFHKTAVKSLAQRANRKRIFAENARWNICTDSKYFAHLERVVDVYFPELELNFILREDLRGFIDPIQSAVVWQIEEALRLKKKVLLAPPDTIFSDGTIDSMLDIATKDQCVAVPHARALPEILNEDYLCPNRSLVDLTWRHLHKSWSDAREGCDGYNFRAGGVSWKETGDGSKVGIHMLPSPYLLQFTEEDLQFFRRQISFGGFDHIWPTQMLIPQGRRVYLGDSDKAFIIEITDQFKNVPPIFPGDQNVFWREDTRNELTKAELEPNRRESFCFMGEVK